MWNKLQNWLNKCVEIDITALPPEGKVELPTKLLPFIWYFVRQIKHQLAYIMTIEMTAGIVISASFWYVGVLVRAENYGAALMLGLIALVALRWVTEILLYWLYEVVYSPHFGNLVRRQLFWYVSRHSLAYYQNDFAGRIGNKLLQSAPSLRDALHSSVGAIWFVLTFTISNVWIMSNQSIWLAAPMYAWMLTYVVILLYFVPKVQREATLHSEDMSQLTGQTVDVFTNFLPAKYFARIEQEDERVMDLLKNHSRSFRKTNVQVMRMGIAIQTMNLFMVSATGWVGLYLLEQGRIDIAAIAVALPMVIQATFQSGWIMREVSRIFENLGAVQEGIDTLAKPHGVTDVENAPALKVTPKTAEIDYKDVHFHYDRTDGVRVLEGFNLHIPAGQKVGVVGRSGAGKSTLTSLLVRAYDVEQGRVNIAKQNIALCNQDTVRRAITVVTQESYLFHRSVFDNISYGKPNATQAQVEAAAKAAHAHEFIVSLSDSKGRTGYEAHVGERGVKLSGGQKQRIAIARAILKDAPILILDEATSALDSESEQAIQDALEDVMDGKTVLAIAHRLSTLSRMDRILVMDAGQIVEDGTHAELLKQGGIYADLWNHQTGGYLPKEAA